MGREREAVATPVILHEKPTALPEQYRVMVPIANPNSAQGMIDIAARMARPVNGQLILLHIGRVPPQTPLAGGRRSLERMRPAVEQSTEIADKLELDPESVLRLAHDPWRAIVDTIEDHKVDSVVMGWKGRSLAPQTMIDRNIDKVLKYANCNVLIVQQKAAVPARRILVPVAESGSAILLVSVARLLFDESDAESRTTVLHMVPPKSSDAHRDARMERIKQALQQSGPFNTQDIQNLLEDGQVELKSTKSKDIVRSIAMRTRDADLLILGSSRASWFKRAIVRCKPYRIASRSACPVIMVSPKTLGMRFSIQTFFHFFREEPER